jgi:hypothetical protein
MAAPGSLDGVVVVDDGGAPAAAFRTDEALGAGIDGSEEGGAARFFRPATVAKLRTAGLAPITYRLRTELAGEAWHWSEEGRWSDAAHAQGYWTGDPHTKAPILLTHGYNLPRRGNTVDQANDEGYSRIDDGDLASFWKSNPYLDRAHAGAGARPQWIKVRFDHIQAINTAVIAWGEPYARDYALQYWTGADEYDPDGRWTDFPGGLVTEGRGGEARLSLAAQPVRTQFVRLLLQAGSGTAPAGADDPRDHLGYAVRELSVGLTGADGVFHDAVRHGAGRHAQTEIWVSSTDPWHRAADRDDQLEQPGLDRLYASGVTNGLPVLIGTPALYDTPENTAALAAFLKWRGYPVRGLEIGEEPDGQYVDAEDYAALYVQMAAAIHGAWPRLALGGPSLQSAEADTFLDDNPDHSWTRRLVRALKAEGAMGDLNFFSFERYPFDDICGDMPALLQRQTAMMRKDLARLKADEVPASIPWLITEYGFSAFAGRAEVELPSALLHADMLGAFLTEGGAGAYLFGYGPNDLVNQHLACAGEGNLMLYEADASGAARWPMPAYWGARLEVGPWAQRGHGLNSLYRAAWTAKEGKDSAAVVAYALKRPDGRWSVMLLNRDAHRPASVRLAFASGLKPGGPLEGWRYSPRDYGWDAAKARPSRDRPPEAFTPIAGRPLELPPLSMTVIRGVGRP